MAGVNGDLLRCVDTQTYLGETVLNVYYYIITALVGITGDYLDTINTSFESTVIAAVTTEQNGDLVHTNREWRNLTNNVDIFNEDTAIPGAGGSGDSLNSFTSIGFLLRRTDLNTRNGYKRFAGLTEGRVNGNTYTFSSTHQADIENALAAPLFDGIAELCRPVIVKRPIPVPAVGVVHSDVLSAQFRGLGTQNTRKPGRGI